MELTQRQLQIVGLLSKKGILTGEWIAERLELSKSALRNDFSTLTQLGYVESKPKVGYRLLKDPSMQVKSQLVTVQYKVKEVMQVPLVVDRDVSVYEAIVMMFLENTGSIIVLQEGYLAGILSRKDFIKVAMGGADLNKLPVGMVMTRMPNVIVAYPDETTLLAAQKILEHQIDSLPVVEIVDTEQGKKAKVLGKFSKTTIAKLYSELYNPMEVANEK